MKNLLSILNRFKLVIVFVIIFTIASFNSKYFFTVVNIINLFTQVSTYGIVACGMTFVVISGEFDISVGSVMVLAGVMVVALINTVGWIVAILAAIALAFFAGILYSILVVKLNLSSFIATLAGSIFYRGIAYVITGDGTPFIPNDTFYCKLATTTVLKVPTIVIVFLACTIISQVVLKKTAFGRNIYATGCNYEVAKFAGVNVMFYKTATFVICCFSAVLGGIMMTSRLNTAAPTAAEDAGLTALSAVVLGGANLSGGSGEIVKTFIGVMILGLITNALNMLGINNYIQLAVKGALLIIFVTMETVLPDEKDSLKRCKQHIKEQVLCAGKTILN